MLGEVQETEGSYQCRGDETMPTVCISSMLKASSAPQVFSYPPSGLKVSSHMLNGPIPPSSQRSEN